uniref:Uncharacterized protein n=1 Tax=viral metagenome TaxID=1070528 RepID=A0A6M3L2S6_9ZZZZ
MKVIPEKLINSCFDCPDARFGYCEYECKQTGEQSKFDIEDYRAGKLPFLKDCPLEDTEEKAQDE